MGRVALSYLLVLLSCVPASGQSTVADWLPLHVGDKWVYLNEDLYGAIGGIAHPEVSSWKTEQTITGSSTIPEGTLVTLRLQLLGPPPSSEHIELHLSPDGAWLIRKNCLYDLAAQDWAPSSHQLTAQFREALSAGQISADFCFPLKVGESWGAPHWGNRPPADSQDWWVRGIRAADPYSLDKRNTFHLVASDSWSYIGSGMSGEVWFEKGVGIVRNRYIHHGTFNEDRTRLLSFQPSP